jgi:hypothetical protein
MFTLEGNFTLKQVVEQGFEEIRESLLQQMKKTIEGLLCAEGDRRIAALRRWAASFSRRWRFWVPAMVGKFQAEFLRVVPYSRWPVRWRHRLRTTNLAEGSFRHLRRWLGRFPGCREAAHSEHVPGCFIRGCEQAHA